MFRFGLMPVISVTWEAEIRRIVVLGQPRQKVNESSPLAPSSIHKPVLVAQVCDPSYMGGQR
jgi:hypothetical protein